MTAAFDGARGTDQRFTDALSGSDGTSDPSVMMPVLDVYPDALSAPMPLDASAVQVRLSVPVVPTGVRAEPVKGPAARQPAPTGRSNQRPAAQRQPAARPPVQSYRPITPAAAAPPVRQQPHTITWQGKAMSATDIAAMVRAGLSGQPTPPPGQQSFQASHPQSMGSAAPQAVAPAAPMASQYSGRGQARNDARERSQERRRTAVPTTKRSSSVGAVLVFIVIILFATGLGQKIIDLVSELLR